eukprot:c1409_g1_i1.p1 GENE.c1409_g1_i1~~c1409_g1_i1.p1  ORF type:complete len:373 (-),score=109.40 c1409_g1_i1:32-1069(-)
MQVNKGSSGKPVGLDRSPSRLNTAVKIISGSSNPALAKRICGVLGMEITACDLGKLSDGESRVQILDSIRGHDVFIVQSASAPVNDHLMELMLLIDAAKRASAKSICAVMPYYGYSRQDKRKRDDRTAVAARLVADLIVAAGATRVLTIDVHADQVQGFFDIPFDNLHFIPEIANHIETLNLPNPIVVATGKAATSHAKLLASRLGCLFVVTDSRKGGSSDLPQVVSSEEAQQQSEESSYVLIGDVKGRSCIVVDDILDIPRMLCAVVGLLYHSGATKCIVASIHGAFAPEGVELLQQANIEQIICSNTISHHPTTAELPNLKILDCANLVADGIAKVHENGMLE